MITSIHIYTHRLLSNKKKIKQNVSNRQIFCFAVISSIVDACCGQINASGNDTWYMVNLTLQLLHTQQSSTEKTKYLLNDNQHQ